MIRTSSSLNKLTLLLLFVISFYDLSGQNFLGKVLDSESNLPIIGATIRMVDNSQEVLTNASGIYRLFDIESESISVSIEAPGYQNLILEVNPDVESKTIPDILLAISRGSNINSSDELDENVITEAQLSLLDDDDQVSSLLTAGRDPFNNAAAFNLNAARFRIRGLPQEYNATYLNGLPFNDLDDGRAFWSIWGGLNDVLRRREAFEGLRSSGFSFGGINGATDIDMRASVQRKQIKAVYNLANFAYSHRAMLTYSTGLLKNGWAFTFSGSRRWAQEGYIRGTFYDAFSYFGGVEKRLNSSHAIGLNVFGAPSKRGRSSASTQEMYDLSGDNFYNPNWGFLNGEVRNPRQYRVHLPVAMLRYDYTPSAKLRLTSSAAFMTGKNASSGIDWFDAPDPRPDYYRNLPSFQVNNEVASQVEEYFLASEMHRQIDLDALYEANQNSNRTIRNVDGIEGNDVTGNLAAYLIQEEHFDTDKFVFNTSLSTSITDRISLNAGVHFINDKNKYFRQIDDLLGADFSVNWDKFAPILGSSNTLVDTLQQNDLENPNRILKEGDIYGHHYHINNQKIGTWANVDFVFSKFDISIGGQINSLSYYRDGKFRNGAFPNNSFGKGPENSFLSGMIKSGVTYKINGRNYLYANGAYGTEAPASRNSYITPRTRHDIIPGLVNEKIRAIEGGYNARYPRFKARLTGYINQLDDQFETRNVYYDNVRQFGNVITTNIDQRFMGTEFGSEFNISSTISGTFAAAYGQHFYTDRPLVSFAIDDSEQINELGEVYIKNYRVASGPQVAATIGLQYRHPKFWSISVNANYFGENYLNTSPFRRFAGIADGPILAYNNVLNALDATSAPADQILDQSVLDEQLGFSLQDVFLQEKFDPAYTVDLYARKSWKIGGRYIVVSASVNNILNNIFRSGGFEQLRTRYEFRDRNEDGTSELVNLFPPKYYYAYGRSYFLTFSISFDKLRNSK